MARSWYNNKKAISNAKKMESGPEMPSRRRQQTKVTMIGEVVKAIDSKTEEQTATMNGGERMTVDLTARDGDDVNNCRQPIIIIGCPSSGQSIADMPPWTGTPTMHDE